MRVQAPPPVVLPPLVRDADKEVLPSKRVCRNRPPFVDNSLGLEHIVDLLPHRASRPALKATHVAVNPFRNSPTGKRTHIENAKRSSPSFHVLIPTEQEAAGAATTAVALAAV